MKTKQREELALARSEAEAEKLRWVLRLGRLLPRSRRHIYTGAHSSPRACALSLSRRGRCGDDELADDRGPRACAVVATSAAQPTPTQTADDADADADALRSPRFRTAAPGAPHLTSRGWQYQLERRGGADERQPREVRRWPWTRWVGGSGSRWLHEKTAAAVGSARRWHRTVAPREGSGTAGSMTTKRHWVADK
uniref:Uncharacterized protein n=1 Tax=Oryza glumipatula TaxID=40148 RepID=A0A0E0AD91_9ORYZ